MMHEFSKEAAVIRSKKCAVHFTAAVVFRESAIRAVNYAETYTLGCIGHYYAGFHIAVSALWITETVKAASLNRIRHAAVRKLVEENLKKTKRIKAAFMSDYIKLQEYREKSNYRFFFDRKELDYSEIAPGLAGRTESMLNCVVPYVRDRLVKLDQLATIQRYVGDGIGDNLIDLHVSPAVRRKVLDWLAGQQLAT
jgi:hypothetical protein